MLLENDYFTLYNKGNGRFSLKMFLYRESNMENRFKSVFEYHWSSYDWAL